MTVVIDDRLLLDGLAGKAPRSIAEELTRGQAFTTSAWYYRLGRAVLAGTGTAALSGRLERLDPDVRDRVRTALHDLPEGVGLLHPRVVVPVMFSLRVGRHLNLLTAEALAVAVCADDRCCCSDLPVAETARRIEPTPDA